MTRFFCIWSYVYAINPIRRHLYTSSESQTMEELTKTPAIEVFFFQQCLSKKKQSLFQIQYLSFLYLILCLCNKQLHMFPACISLQHRDLPYHIKIVSPVMYSLYCMIKLMVNLSFSFFVVHFLSSCNFPLISQVH